MARRPRRPRTPSPPTAPESTAEVSVNQQALLALGEKISKFAEDAPVVTIAAPMMASTFSDKRQWRQLNITPDMELVFERAHLGKRNKIIFRFKPLETQEYDFVEFDEDKVFTAFPSLQGTISMLVTPDEIMSDSLSNLFPVARQAFIKSYIAGVKREKKDAEEARTADITAAYEDNPLFGAF